MLLLPQIWIVGILGLSVFWCVISLLAISRLEKRLPSEMQEQLEFHKSFSGLWPRNQGAHLLFMLYTRSSKLQHEGWQ